MKWKRHLRHAITLLGSQKALAEALTAKGRPCTQQKISLLLTSRYDRISAEDSMAIEAVTRGRVLRSDLRPDLWPPT